MFLKESFSPLGETTANLKTEAPKLRVVKTPETSTLKAGGLSEKALSLQELRALVSQTNTHKVKDFFSFSKIPKGVPKGSLIAMSGPGKTQLMVEFLREQQDLKNDFKVAWIEPTWTLNPSALLHLGLNPKNILCIETENDFYWAALQVAQSGLFEAVVCTHKNLFSEKQMRSLQLACEATQTSCFLLLPQKQSHWCLGYEIEVSRQKSSINFDLRKSRCG